MTRRELLASLLALASVGRAQGHHRQMELKLRKVGALWHEAIRAGVLTRNELREHLNGVHGSWIHRSWILSRDEERIFQQEDALGKYLQSGRAVRRL